MTRLVLCRHTDPASRQHASALAANLAALPLAAVYTSPLPRAAASAAAIGNACGLVPVEVRDLREIEFGAAEGLGFDELPADLQRGLLERPTRVRFPGGETFADLQQRVVPTLDAIVRRHPDEVVAVVSHAGAIRAALAAWLLIEGEAIFRLDQRYGAVNVVDWVDGTPLVRLVNGSADGSQLRFDTGASARRSMTD